MTTFYTVPELFVKRFHNEHENTAGKSYLIEVAIFKSEIDAAPFHHSNFGSCLFQGFLAVVCLSPDGCASICGVPKWSWHPSMNSLAEALEVVDK